MGSIVFLASYPKSGNTWLRMFLANLFANAREPLTLEEAGRLTAADNPRPWYEAVDGGDPAGWSRAHVARLRHAVQRHLAEKAPDVLFMKSHAALLPMEGQAPFVPDLMGGAIYLVRNPLDVAPSYARHSGVAVERILGVMAETGYVVPRHAATMEYVQGSWSQHVESWTRQRHPRLHVLRYEDMVSDPPAALGGVARFLGLEPPAERLERAIRHSSLATLRRLEDEEGFHERVVEGVRFFGEGGVGAWRAALTDAQARAIVAVHRAQMARFGYVPEGW